MPAFQPLAFSKRKHDDDATDPRKRVSLGSSTSSQVAGNHGKSEGINEVWTVQW